MSRPFFLFFQKLEKGFLKTSVETKPFLFPYTVSISNLAFFVKRFFPVGENINKFAGPFKSPAKKITDYILRIPKTRRGVNPLGATCNSPALRQKNFIYETPSLRARGGL